MVILAEGCEKPTSIVPACPILKAIVRGLAASVVPARCISAWYDIIRRLLAYAVVAGAIGYGRIDVVHFRGPGQCT